MPFHKEWQRKIEEETFVAKQFTASKSLLEKYFSGCAHRAYLYRRWDMVEKHMPKQLVFGIEVHGLIEDGLSGRPLKSEDKKAIERAERALNWVDKSGYEILGLEERHFARLTDDITLFGIIDCIALDKNKEPVLIDWKTATANWTTTLLEDGSRVYIGAAGWQGPIYLTVPTESSILKPSAWPLKMQYVVIPKAGTVGVYEYYKNEADDQALVQACQAVKVAWDTGNFPKNKGTWTCNNCDFKRVCWETKGWEKFYKKRGKK